MLMMMDKQDALINNENVRFNYNIDNLKDGSINAWIRDTKKLKDYSFGSNFMTCKRVCNLLNLLDFELENQTQIKFEAYNLLNEYQYYFDKDIEWSDFDHKDLKELKRLSCMTRDLLLMDNVDLKNK